MMNLGVIQSCVIARPECVPAIEVPRFLGSGSPVNRCSLTLPPLALPPPTPMRSCRWRFFYVRPSSLSVPSSPVLKSLGGLRARFHANGLQPRLPSCLSLMPSARRMRFRAASPCDGASCAPRPRSCRRPCGLVLLGMRSCLGPPRSQEPVLAPTDQFDAASRQRHRP